MKDDDMTGRVLRAVWKMPSVLVRATDDKSNNIKYLERGQCRWGSPALGELEVFCSSTSIGPLLSDNRGASLINFFTYVCYFGPFTVQRRSELFHSCASPAGPRSASLPASQASISLGNAPWGWDQWVRS